MLIIFLKRLAHKVTGYDAGKIQNRQEYLVFID